MTLCPPSPFQSLPDWHNNACINNYMQFEELAMKFLRSADALVACAVGDRTTLDDHIYAICYLYRHSCELLLKDLFWKSNYAANGNKSFCKTHRLLHLWRGIRERAHELLGEDFPLTAEETAELERLFAWIEEHDLNSDSFRYPWDTKNRRTHPSLVHVNVRALCESIHQAVGYLCTIGCMVEYHYDERSEYER